MGFAKTIEALTYQYTNHTKNCYHARFGGRTFFTTVVQTDDNGNAMLPKKKKNFKDTRQQISEPLAMSAN